MKRFASLATAFLLGMAVPSPSGAQHLVPAGARMADAMPERDSRPSIAVTMLPDSTIKPINRTGGIVGGVLGGAAGALAGAALGVQQSQGCQEEFCDLGAGLLGLIIGEPIGLAVGTHLGARGHGSVLLSSMTSFGILLVGGAIAAGASQLGPAVGVPAVVAVPVLQIMAALAIER